MKRYLVDTTVFVDHLRNKSWATDFLEREGLVISLVTAAELIQGAEDKIEQKIVEELVDQFEINWGSVKINRLGVKLMIKHFLKDNLRFLDALIASTALENNLILITDNIKHFKFIKGLKVKTPEKRN